MTSQSNDQPNAPAGLQLSDATNVAGIRRVEEATALPWAELVAASRTLVWDAGELRDRAGAALVAAGVVAGMPVGADARTSETPKRHYWRSGLGDAAKLEVAIEAAAARKSTGSGESPRARVTLTARGLADQDQRDAARSDLKTVLADLG